MRLGNDTRICQFIPSVLPLKDVFSRNMDGFGGVVEVSVDSRGRDGVGTRIGKMILSRVYNNTPYVFRDLRKT